MNLRLTHTLIVGCAMTAAILLCPFFASADDSTTVEQTQRALVRLVVDHIDSTLTGVAASTAAVANEFVEASRATPADVSNPDALCRGRYRVRETTVMFQSWAGSFDATPGYQAAVPAYFSYRGEHLTDAVCKGLEVLRKVTPAVRAAYRADSFSWSYITTADELMLIYPFLTLDEAVKNDPPTKQTYYRHADFEHRRAGWTPPYLDLVGAGMMVTVSTPAYEGDRLLGVVSHDITLDQLSERVLGLLTRDARGTAWLVDESGLVIGVSDPELAKELDEINQRAGEAVLYYRLPGDLKSGQDNAQVSGSTWVNEVTEAVFSRTQATRDGGLIHFELGDRQVYGATLKITGWRLIWIAPVP